MHQVLLISVAGAFGTLARFTLTEFVRRLGGSVPWGIAIVNVLGPFLFGLIWSLAEDRLSISPQTRLVILTSFMGAFTTFSTFVFESNMLLQDSRWLLALASIAGQTLIGLVFMILGLTIGKVG